MILPLKLLIATFKCILLYGVVSGVIISYIYSAYKEKNIGIKNFNNIVAGCGWGGLAGFALLIISILTLNTTSEMRTTEEVISENKLVNLNLVTGQNSNFYMVLGSGSGESQTSFTYFYYIESDGRFKPEKTDIDEASFADLPEESAPKVVKTKVRTSEYSKSDNSYLTNLLGVDLSTDYLENDDFFSIPDTKEETTFYISKEKISNEIDPNLKD